MNPKSTILIIDDDPIHAQIYRMIVETAGFRGLPVLVAYDGMEFPDGEPVDAVLLDYCLGPHLSALKTVHLVKQRYPSVPILILSDLQDAPADTAPLVQAFVRKGNPERLLATLHGVIEESLKRA